MDGQSPRAPRSGGDSHADETDRARDSVPRGSDVSDLAERRLANRMDRANRSLSAARESTNLADILERVLDKGIVIAGDITLAVAGIDLLTLKIRLLVASVDKAQEMGINWWQSDPFLSSRAKEQADVERGALLERIESLEARLGKPADGRPQLESGRDDSGETPQPERRREQAG